MKNFRVIRIDAINGQARLLYDFLTENDAWKKAHHLERLEAEQPYRRAWYAATNQDDYKALAREFYSYRKMFAIS